MTRSWRCLAVLTVIVLAAFAAMAALGAAQTGGSAPDLKVRVALSRMSVAVLPLDGRDEELASQVTELLAAHLSTDVNLDLVERAKLSEVLEEQGLTKAGLVDPATAQRVGYLVGAQALILGRAFELDRKIYLVARVVGVETGRVFVRQVNGPVTGQVGPLVSELAGLLAKALATHRDALVAASISPDREAALAKLVDSVKDKPKPGVVINVSETHYGAAAVDPAAETELMLWFKRAGFDVFAPQGTMPALDKLPPEVGVVITGDAFSEAAGEIGRFKVAKVRIEVKAIDQHTGQVLAVARRVGTAADLSERAAAKSGLSIAAANIAHELIPKLVSGAASSH